MIEEATVDCYDDIEAETGFFTMIEENLRLPFMTNVLGVDVTVVALEQNDKGVYAVCKHKNKTQRIPITELPLPLPCPKGAEWIDAYRRWARGCA